MCILYHAATTTRLVQFLNAHARPTSPPLPRSARQNPFFSLSFGFEWRKSVWYVGGTRREGAWLFAIQVRGPLSVFRVRFFSVRFLSFRQIMLCARRCYHFFVFLCNWTWSKDILMAGRERLLGPFARSTIHRSEVSCGVDH